MFCAWVYSCDAFGVALSVQNEWYTDALHGVCVLWAPLVSELEETNKEGRFSNCGKGTKHIFTYM